MLFSFGGHFARDLVLRPVLFLASYNFLLRPVLFRFHEGLHQLPLFLALLPQFTLRFAGRVLARGLVPFPAQHIRCAAQLGHRPPFLALHESPFARSFLAELEGPLFEQSQVVRLLLGVSALSQGRRPQQFEHRLAVHLRVSSRRARASFRVASARVLGLYFLGRRWLRVLPLFFAKSDDVVFDFEALQLGLAPFRFHFLVVIVFEDSPTFLVFLSKQKSLVILFLAENSRRTGVSRFLRASCRDVLWATLMDPFFHFEFRTWSDFRMPKLFSVFSLGFCIFR